MACSKSNVRRSRFVEAPTEGSERLRAFGLGRRADTRLWRLSFDGPEGGVPSENLPVERVAPPRTTAFDLFFRIRIKGRRAPRRAVDRSPLAVPARLGRAASAT